jgi:hypothetical protein
MRDIEFQLFYSLCQLMYVLLKEPSLVKSFSGIGPGKAKDDLV